MHKKSKLFVFLSGNLLFISCEVMYFSRFRACALNPQKSRPHKIVRIYSTPHGSTRVSIHITVW